MQHKTTLGATALLLLTSPVASAQFVENDVRLLYELAGEAQGDNFGLELVAIADYDGDGAREFLVSAPGNDGGANNAGKVYLFDGATGALIRSHAGTRPNEARRNVCDAGDVDADGIVDYLVGTGDGWVYVYSGADGSELHALSGTAGEAFGFRACGVGDLDGDGHGELLIGAWSNDSSAPNAGKAYVLSGSDGTLVREHAGVAPQGQFGHTVAAIGDVDGDGVGDYTVGAPGPYSPAARGETFVFSGATGSELLPRLTPQSSGRIFGAWVPSWGGADFNSDGTPDFTVTDLGDGGNDRGRLYVYDGATRALLYDVAGFSGNGGFGGVPPNPPSQMGDVTGDGVPDILVGSWESKVGAFNGGQVDLLDGSVGTRLRTVTSSEPNVFLAGSAAGLNHVDGDAAPDFALGGNGANNSRGKVYVIAGRLPLGTNECGPAVPNSSGLPAEIDGRGSEQVSANDVTLRATQLPADQFGYFLTSELQGFVVAPGSSQGNLCLGQPLARFASLIASSGSSGMLSIRPDLTSLPQLGAVQPGDTWRFQCWFRDMNPGATSNFTDALAITFE